jgi:large subunit ribosomal protein L18
MHPNRSRLVVFKSNKNIEAQIVNDFEGTTIVSASSYEKDLKAQIKKASTKTDVSKLVGETIANKALKQKIKSVVFDRNGYSYHGRVKAFADAARKAGLEF